MIACVSPLRTVSVTPLRISLSPSSVVTETCRSLISRVLMLLGYSLWGYSVQGLLDVDVDVCASYVDRESGDGLRRRQAGGLAGAQVEARTVEIALHRAVLDVALAERHGRVAADV